MHCSSFVMYKNHSATTWLPEPSCKAEKFEGTIKHAVCLSNSNHSATKQQKRQHHKQTTEGLYVRVCGSVCVCACVIAAQSTATVSNSRFTLR